MVLEAIDDVNDSISLTIFERSDDLERSEDFSGDSVPMISDFVVWNKLKRVRKYCRSFLLTTAVGLNDPYLLGMFDSKVSPPNNNLAPGILRQASM